MSMPIVQGHECAVCGALKRDTNHWWLASIREVVSSEGCYTELSITAWATELCKSDRRFAACGYNCTQKLVERFLIKRSLDAPRGAAGDPANFLTASGAHTFREQPGAEIRATTKKE